MHFASEWFLYMEENKNVLTYLDVSSILFSVGISGGVCHKALENSGLFIPFVDPAVPLFVGPAFLFPPGESCVPQALALFLRQPAPPTFCKMEKEWFFYYGAFAACPAGHRA